MEMGKKQLQLDSKNEYSSKRNHFLTECRKKNRLNFAKLFDMSPANTKEKGNKMDSKIIMISIIIA